MSQTRNKKGFTLVEVLVVVAIIIVILALTLVSYRAGNQRLVLKRSAHKLAQDIRRAQEMAMSTREFQGGIPLRGYGLIFYSFNFFDKDFVHSYKINAFTRDNESIPVEQVKLENGVKVSKLYSISGTGETERMFIDFHFIPPDPTMCFLADCSAIGAKIVLSLDSDSSVTKTVKINKAGLIEIIE